MCLTETLDEMVQNGTLSPELAIQVLVQFEKGDPARTPPSSHLSAAHHRRSTPLLSANMPMVVDHTCTDSRERFETQKPEAFPTDWQRFRRLWSQLSMLKRFMAFSGGESRLLGSFLKSWNTD